MLQGFQICQHVITRLFSPGTLHISKLCLFFFQIKMNAKIKQLIARQMLHVKIRLVPTHVLAIQDTPGMERPAQVTTPQADVLKVGIYANINLLD
jgi:hypothetical protein